MITKNGSGMPSNAFLFDGTSRLTFRHNKVKPLIVCDCRLGIPAVLSNYDSTYINLLEDIK